MWPFATPKVWNRLAAGGAAEPFHVSVVTTLISPASAASPFTGIRAGLVFVELLERMPAFHDARVESQTVSDQYDLLATAVLGDVVTLRDEGGDEITIVARRARIEPALPRQGGVAMMHVPSEIVPLLHKATGRGVLCYRELTFATGDKLRLRAVVEPTRSVVADGHRSGTRTTYLARDDLAAVVLEEVFEAPLG